MQFFGYPAQCLVTVLTELSQLLFIISNFIIFTLPVTVIKSRRIKCMVYVYIM
jgi:hypothetical protein